MSVRIVYDEIQDEAVLYDSGSDWAFGPVFQGDAGEKAARFRAWFENGQALEHARTIGIKPYGILGADGDDPRDFAEHDLSRLYLEWKDIALDGDGDLTEAPQAVEI